ncbi:MAG: AAA domain-containing protein [Nitrososphaerota archaeon]
MHQKLDYYVKRILDLSQKNRAIYFAISADGQTDWRQRTIGFKILNSAVYDLMDGKDVLALKFSVAKNEFQGGCIEIERERWNEVENGLRKLYMKNREFLKDSGVSICYVVYGFLIWQERPNNSRGIWVKSPLFVAEANLERKLDRRRGQIVYQLSATTPFRLNESLIEMLRLQYGIDFTKELSEGYESGEVGTVEFEEPEKLEQAIRTIEETLLDINCKIEREVWIAALYFGTIGIYYDAKHLFDSGRFERSRIIRALCGSEEAQPIQYPRYVSDEEVDRMETLLPADRSQCEVIYYAERGWNVVVHGPPGTGKSQTIANLIARAIKNGKRVLFVAEKREAIDVVYSRLNELKLTKPVLKIFTLTNRERDEVLRDLVDTVEYVYQNSSLRWVSSIAFPEKEYEYERKYFELLTQSTESRSLYALIGELVLKERNLERWVLLNIADRYERSNVWANVQKIDKLALKSYWKKVIEFFKKLPFTPSQEELNILSQLDSLLSTIRTQFGNLSREDLIAFLEIVNELHDDLIYPQRSEILNFCLGLSNSELRELQEILTQFSSNIERLINIRTIRKKLPDRENILHLYEQLYKYNSWLTRIFSGEYKRLRIELDEQLGISRRLPHEEALMKVNSLVRELDELELEEYAQKEEIRRLVVEVMGSPYRSFLSLLSKDSSLRNVLLNLSNISSVIKKLLDIRGQAQIVKVLEFLKRYPHFFKSIAEQKSADDINRIIEVLNKMPKHKDIEALLNTMTEINKLLRRLESGLVTFFNIIEQLINIPELATLISELPIETTYEQFEILIDYLKLKDQYNQIIYGETRREKTRVDPRITENCIDIMKRFYIEVEQNYAIDCLSGWLRRVSNYLGPQSMSHAYLSKDFYQKLRRECIKKRKKITLRRLFNEYLDYILQIKPIVMMSTTAVSAILPRNFDEEYFDIVIFDEASQIRIETALPSIARAKQLLVIGDEHQMPPSRYFERLSFLEEEEEEEEELPESLLVACLNSPVGFFKELELNWYYRGIHESLIAFSNKHFYQNKLIILPSPNPDDLRIEFVTVHCPSHPSGGCYIEGKAINPCEARVVLRKLLEILSKTPRNDFTVGVVAMNEKQQEVIENLIQEACQETNIARIEEMLGVVKSSLDGVLGEQGAGQLIISDELIDKLETMVNEDKIWIRNLESVQGKEADYIILSMTYGKGKDGRLRQQFGPINREGGERRLNVLISRAREKMIVVSSMRATDLRVDFNTPKGIRILRDFLKYAEDGGRFYEERDTIMFFESPFEESVYHYLVDALLDLGVEIVPQVGVGKYRIDLGVKKGGKYLLGIECDGTLYHKHRTARERDRIRDESLKRMGWEIYRIWSTTWFIKHLRTEILNDIKKKVIDKLNEMAAHVNPSS